MPDPVPTPRAATLPPSPASSDEPAPRIVTGMVVAAFERESTSGPWRSDATGHDRLVVFFYARDGTPGCTDEATGFARQAPALAALGATVVGVSRDSVASHRRFRAKFDLPFELLADTDETLCRRFGVIRLKNMYGRQVHGIERSTFVLGPAGPNGHPVLHVWYGVRVPGHVDAVLTRLKEFSASDLR